MCGWGYCTLSSTLAFVFALEDGDEEELGGKADRSRADEQQIKSRSIIDQDKLLSL